MDQGPFLDWALSLSCRTFSGQLDQFGGFYGFFQGEGWDGRSEEDGGTSFQSIVSHFNFGLWFGVGLECYGEVFEPPFFSC